MTASAEPRGPEYDGKVVKSIHRQKLLDMVIVSFILFAHSVAPLAWYVGGSGAPKFSSKFAELSCLICVMFSWPFLLGGGLTLFSLRSSTGIPESGETRISSLTHTLSELKWLKFCSVAITVGTALQGFGGLAWLLELRAHEGTIGLIILAIISSALLGVLSLLMGRQANHVSRSVNVESEAQLKKEAELWPETNHQPVHESRDSM